MDFAEAELACPRVEGDDVRALTLCVLRLVAVLPARRPFTLRRELELGRASGARAHLGTLRSPVIPSRLPAPDTDGRPPTPAEIANGLCIPVYSSLTLYIFARPQKFRKRPVHGSKGSRRPSSSAQRPHPPLCALEDLPRYAFRPWSCNEPRRPQLRPVSRPSRYLSGDTELSIPLLPPPVRRLCDSLLHYRS